MFGSGKPVPGDLVYESTSEVNDTDLGETSPERVDGVIGVLTLLIFVMCISQVFA